MSLQIIKDTGVAYDPVFLKILEDIPGGVTVKTNRFPTDTKEIKKGTLLNADASTAGLYNVIKSVRLTAAYASNVTAMAVEAPHLFKVGEYIHIYGVTAGTISRVAATGIVCAAIAHAAVASGTVLAEAVAAATTDYAVKYAASAVLRDTIEVRKPGVATLSANVFAGAVVRGTVDESELPYFVTDADKTALTARVRFA
ncbi:MAG: hypothetical protein KAX28_14575 [Candidatus Marinimicrobia bacterium]|nr:hypothetical protein [Candidatus Neomarinimicrobiota bacterium]